MSDDCKVKTLVNGYEVKHMTNRKAINDHFTILRNGKPYDNLNFLLAQQWVSHSSLMYNLEETYLGNQEKTVLELPGCDEKYEFILRPSAKLRKQKKTKE